MNRLTRGIHDFVSEYQAGLLIVAVIAALGFLMGPPPAVPQAASRHQTVSTCETTVALPTR